MDTSASDYDRNKDFSILSSEEALDRDREESSPLIKLKKKENEGKRDKSDTTDEIDSSDTSEASDFTPLETTDKSWDDKAKLTSPLISEPVAIPPSFPSPPAIPDRSGKTKIKTKSSSIHSSSLSSSTSKSSQEAEGAKESKESKEYSSFSSVKQHGEKTTTISPDDQSIRSNESSIPSIDDMQISDDIPSEDKEDKEVESARKGVEKLHVDDSQSDSPFRDDKLKLDSNVAEEESLSSPVNTDVLLTDSPLPVSKSQLDSLDNPIDNRNVNKSDNINTNVNNNDNLDKLNTNVNPIKNDNINNKDVKDVKDVKDDKEINKPKVKRSRHVRSKKDVKDVKDVQKKGNFDKKIDSPQTGAVDDKNKPADVNTNLTRPPNPLLHSDLSSPLSSPQS